jgi:hypothetical protein
LVPTENQEVEEKLITQVALQMAQANKAAAAASFAPLPPLLPHPPHHRHHQLHLPQPRMNYWAQWELARLGPRLLLFPINVPSAKGSTKFTRSPPPPDHILWTHSAYYHQQQQQQKPESAASFASFLPIFVVAISLCLVGF